MSRKKKPRRLGRGLPGLAPAPLNGEPLAPDHPGAKSRSGSGRLNRALRSTRAKRAKSSTPPSADAQAGSKRGRTPARPPKPKPLSKPPVKKKSQPRPRPRR